MSSKKEQDDTDKQVSFVFFFSRTNIESKLGMTTRIRMRDREENEREGKDEPQYPRNACGKR